MMNCNFVRVLVVPGCKLGRDDKGDKVDSTSYKQLIGSLMYISATRPDMMYAASLIN